MSLLGLIKKGCDATKLRAPVVLCAMERLLTDQRGHNLERDRDLDWEQEHMHECARIARVLASRRHINPDLAACAVAVQNMGRIIQGRTENHAELGCQPARELFLKLGCFTPGEIEMMVQSVRHHSRKDRIDSPLDELAKDADIYVRYMTGDEFTQPYDIRRLSVVQADFLRSGKK